MRLSPNELQTLTHYAISAASQAGCMIAEKAKTAPKVNRKANSGSLAAQVVTEVDHLSQDIILQALQPTCERFDIALLSEEQPDNQERLQKDYFWSIDPLDGTLPFIEQVSGYSVSIALVSRSGIPINGVIYDPCESMLYHAVRGFGVFRNGQPWSAPSWQSKGRIGLTLLTDKSFAQEQRYQAVVEALEAISQDLGYDGYELRLQGGAAMNACLVVTEFPACYFKLPKQQPGGGSLWDYAASACIFKELGLHVSDSFGAELELNRAQSTFMSHKGVLYCSDSRLVEPMLTLARIHGSLITE